MNNATLIIRCDVISRLDACLRELRVVSGFVKPPTAYNELMTAHGSLQDAITILCEDLRNEVKATTP